MVVTFTFTVTVTLTLSCRHCGSAFIAKRRSAKYCNDNCHSRVYRAAIDSVKADARKRNQMCLTTLKVSTIESAGTVT
jgi:hypothetical protein